MGKMTNTEILIIGGGYSGIVAALSAARKFPNKSITILEGSHSIGRKILVSGAGRCNFTNSRLQNSPENYFYNSDKKLLRSIFNQCGFQDIINYYEDIGILWYEESKTEMGKIFPISDSAKNILKIFESQLAFFNIQALTGHKVVDVEKEGEKFFVSAKVDEKTNAYFYADKVILTTGGRSYPGLGSDGSGYALARKFGHNIVEPVPAGCPLLSKNPICSNLAGTKIKANLRLINKNSILGDVTGDLLFTKKGISGNTIFALSRVVSVGIHREKSNDYRVLINFTEMESFRLIKHFEVVSKKNPKLPIIDILYGIVNFKLANYLIDRLKIPQNAKFFEIEKEKIHELVKTLTDFGISITGTGNWNEAEFTSGGVETSEVNSVTLESLKVKGLYLSGEILNIDGEIGGFNMSWAFASGYIAGKLNN